MQETANKVFNIALLKKELDKMNIPRSWYSIGSYGEEALCILFENEQWIVFEGEHGQRFNAHSFYQEDIACQYFLDRMRSLLSPKEFGHVG